MRIGLARHFPVPHRRAERVHAEGFARWAAWYDTTESLAVRVDGESRPWDSCWSSDLARARLTAARLHDGPVTETPLLREVPFGPVSPLDVALPLWAWQAVARVAWAVEHPSQPEGRSETRRRARDTVQALLDARDGERVLVVAHGFYMHALAAELRRRGFRGRVPLRPVGGAIYEFAADSTAD